LIFFIADMHLGHANIIKHCDRPFSSVEEMDEHLISAWNKSVRPNDSVYILGDLIFRSTASPDSYLSRLRGKKHLILGNHDKDWIRKLICLNILCPWSVLQKFLITSIRLRCATIRL